MRYISVWLLATGVWAQEAPMVERELARIAKVGGGVVGATAIHLETGQRVSVNGKDSFPMASTFKVPIAVTLLNLVDKGEEKLTRMVTLFPDDFHPGSGTLTSLFNPPGFNQAGVALSLRHLLELMLLISDNSATDVLLREVGGPAAVNQRLAALNVEGVRVDGPTITMIQDARKNGGKPVAKDQSTPDGMADLLLKIVKGEALGKESTELLMDIMRRCQTGNARLKGLLPEGTVVRHKTGTLNYTANDVGIIELPNGAGRVVMAAFVKESEQPSEKRERALAEMARAVHDYFLFQGK